MTRVEFLKKYLLKFAIVLALLALLLYLFSHALGMTEGSLHTMPVRTVSDRQITSANAYLFRDERVLYTEEAGLVDALAENGAKVRKNTAVAMFYSMKIDAATMESRQNGLDQVNRYLDILEGSQLPAGTPVSDANGFRDEAVSRYREIRDAIARGSFDELSAHEDEFLIQLNRYMVLSGKTESLESLLTTLRAEKQRLLNGTGKEIRDEATDGESHTSGTFYDRNYVDGYEGIFNMEALASLTPERFADLQRQHAQTSGTVTVGKMVYGYSWYLAMNLSNEVAERFEEGGTYSFTFPENDDRTLTLTLVTRAQGDAETMLVFRADSTPAGFDYHRVQRVEITVERTEGFYVPESALQTRTVDGKVQDGVYVFKNSVVRFRRIEVLYRGDGYCIVARPDESKITELTERDILITSGRDLYDGKGYQ